MKSFCLRVFFAILIIANSVFSMILTHAGKRSIAIIPILAAILFLAYYSEYMPKNRDSDDEGQQN